MDIYYLINQNYSRCVYQELSIILQNQGMVQIWTVQAIFFINWWGKTIRDLVPMIKPTAVSPINPNIVFMYQTSFRVCPSLLRCFTVFPDHSGTGAAKPGSSTASNGQPVSSQNSSSLSLLGAYTDSDDSNSDQDGENAVAFWPAEIKCLFSDKQN